MEIIHNSMGFVKNHPITPILKLKKELKRFCDVVDIDNGEQVKPVINILNESVFTEIKNYVKEKQECLNIIA